MKNVKKRAITDLNAPNSSRDIPLQSQKFEQDGHLHFVGFQPHVHLNMTSQTQFCKIMKNENAISQQFFLNQFLKKNWRYTLLIVRKHLSFVFEQRLIILVLVAIATRFEIKRNSFAYF